MDKMSDVLKLLAEKLGTTVEELGPHVVAHVRMEALVSMILGGAIALLFAIAGGYGVYKAWCWAARDKFDDSDSMTLAIVTSAALAIVVITAAGLGASYIPSFLEPVGATLRLLIGK